MMVRILIRAFDVWLRSKLGVYEFCQDPACLLRLQQARSRHQLCLPKTIVKVGEPVLFLHLWNERLQCIPSQGPDLGWARPMQRGFLHSLWLAARYMRQSPQLADVRAVGAVTVLAGPGSGGSHLLQRLGFTVIPFHQTLGAFGEFWENYYTWLLMWAYNPGSLQYKHLWGLKRAEIWISAEAFLELYG